MRLGPYDVLTELGSGGMGTVHRAEVVGRVPGLEAGTVVAIKQIHPHLLERDGFFKRFLREAEIGRRVRHPNVVRVHDCDAFRVDDAVRHILVMEYVEGKTLRALATELGIVPEAFCRQVGRDIAEGLRAIHEAGVVHRDLKPENVVITPAHVVKIMDLGVARLQDEAIHLSQTGQFIGSLEYAAPEQFGQDAQKVDGRVDLHALGLLLYELATGTQPFRDETPQLVIQHVLHDVPAPAARLNPRLSPFFEEVLGTLLAKDRARRFASAAQVAEVLEQGEAGAWWQSRQARHHSTATRRLRRGRLARDTAIYGREAPLELLRAAFESAQAGRGQVRLIGGEVGIGKSRVADELVSRLEEDGEKLHVLYGAYPAGGAATAAGAFSTAYREYLGSEGLEDRLTQLLPDLPALVPGFAAVLRGEPSPSGREPLSRDALQTAFVQTTRALAAERPVVLLIEDLHFAPEEGLALFAALAQGIAEDRILQLGTLQPSLAPAWLQAITGEPHAGLIELERLGAKDLVMLLEDLLQSRRLAEDLAGRVAIKSDGNPYFAFEIVRGLRERGLLHRRPDGPWEMAAALRDLELPSSVTGMVRSRVGALDRRERHLLEVAACLGFEFDPLLIGDVLDLPRITLLQTLASIEAEHGLVRSVGTHWVFDQHLVRDVLEEDLPDLLRREYHAAIGDVLAAQAQARGSVSFDGATAVALCEHYLAGGRDDDAVGVLDAALDHLEAGYLNDRVLGLARRVLEAPGLLAGGRRAALLLRVADRLHTAGLREEEETAIEEELSLAREIGDEELESKGLVARGTLSWSLARTSRARADFEAARDLARRMGDKQREAQAMGNLGVVAWGQGHLDEARQLFDGCRELASEIGDPVVEARASGNLGHVALALGLLADALEDYEAHRTLAAAAGLHESEGRAAGNAGQVLLLLGRWDEAEAPLAHHLRVARETGSRIDEAFASLNLAELDVCRGHAERAAEAFARVLALAQRIRHRRGEAHTLLMWGGLETECGDVTAAAERFDDAASIAAQYGFVGVEVQARARRACLPGGDTARALEVLASHEARVEVLDRMRASYWLFHATGERSLLEDARRLLEHVRANAPEVDRERLVERVALYRAIRDGTGRDDR